MSKMDRRNAAIAAYNKLMADGDTDAFIKELRRIKEGRS